MTAPAVSGPGGAGGPVFAVTVPPGWFELELAPAWRDDAIAALVRERVAGQPELWPHRATISRVLRRQAGQAWEGGARFCACLVEPTDSGPITASVTVSVVPGPVGVRPGGDGQLAALLAPLAPRAGRGPDDTWRQVDAVQLTGGVPAARAWGVEDVQLAPGAAVVRVVQLLQLAPVPGGGQVVVLAGSSPVLALTDVLLELFAAIADTVQVSAA